jgi:hypothetical protein
MKIEEIALRKKGLGSDSINMASMTSRKMKQKVIQVFNSTSGGISDTLNSRSLLNGENPKESNEKKSYETVLAALKTGKIKTVISHSQGGIISGLALKALQADKNDKKMIEDITWIAAGGAQNGNTMPYFGWEDKEKNKYKQVGSKDNEDKKPEKPPYPNKVIQIKNKEDSVINLVRNIPFSNPEGARDFAGHDGEDKVILDLNREADKGCKDSNKHNFTGCYLRSVNEYYKKLKEEEKAKGKQK